MSLLNYISLLAGLALFYERFEEYRKQYSI